VPEDGQDDQRFAIPRVVLGLVHEEQGMSDALLGSVATGLAGGVGLGAIVLALLFIVRGAIATAVTQAGAKEIERLKGQLAGELEKERQAFARELEQTRNAAARALEQFKTELTLGAELRRQVAAARVKAVGEILQKSTELLFAFWGMGGTGDMDGEEETPTKDFWTLSGEYHGLIRQNSHLFSRPVVKEFLDRWGQMTDSASAVKRAGSDDVFPDELPKVQTASDKISDLAREQLDEREQT
jgi:hypothetical protein